MRFKVVQWDGSDRVWTDLTGPLALDDAQEEWNRCTNNGTRNTRYADFDYYLIVPCKPRGSDGRQAA